ncbi:MAG TPA: hypothetical protein VNO70_27905, partial [Blastocatellia bacterium]|nr:hypothetical protein [Blastocatellia bacterium]
MLAFIQAASDFQTIARDTMQLIMPEVILTLFACAGLVLDVMLPRHQKRIVAWVSLAGIGFSLVSLLLVYQGVTRAGAQRTGFFN